jgi:hypothetical protein
MLFSLVSLTAAFERQKAPVLNLENRDNCGVVPKGQIRVKASFRLAVQEFTDSWAHLRIRLTCRKSGEIEVIYSAGPDPEDLPKEIQKKACQ